MPDAIDDLINSQEKKKPGTGGGPPPGYTTEVPGSAGSAYYNLESGRKWERAFPDTTIPMSRVEKEQAGIGQQAGTQQQIGPIPAGWLQVPGNPEMIYNPNMTLTRNNPAPAVREWLGPTIGWGSAKTSAGLNIPGLTGAGAGAAKPTGTSPTAVTGGTGQTMQTQFSKAGNSTGFEVPAGYMPGPSGFSVQGPYGPMFQAYDINTPFGALTGNTPGVTHFGNENNSMAGGLSVSQILADKYGGGRPWTTGDAAQDAVLAAQAYRLNFPIGTNVPLPLNGPAPGPAAAAAGTPAPAPASTSTAGTPAPAPTPQPVALPIAPGVRDPAQAYDTTAVGSIRPNRGPENSAAQSFDMGSPRTNGIDLSQYHGQWLADGSAWFPIAGGKSVPPDIAEKIINAWANSPGNIPTALGLAARESGGNPTAQGTNGPLTGAPGTKDTGVFQINDIHRQAGGVAAGMSHEQLMNPDTNIQVARALFDQNKGFGPWGGPDIYNPKGYEAWAKNLEAGAPPPNAVGPRGGPSQVNAPVAQSFEPTPTNPTVPPTPPQPLPPAPQSQGGGGGGGGGGSYGPSPESVLNPLALPLPTNQPNGAQMIPNPLDPFQPLWAPPGTPPKDPTVTERVLDTYNNVYHNPVQNAVTSAPGAVLDAYNQYFHNPVNNFLGLGGGGSPAAPPTPNVAFAPPTPSLGLDPSQAFDTQAPGTVQPSRIDLSEMGRPTVHPAAAPPPPAPPAELPRPAGPISALNNPEVPGARLPAPVPAATPPGPAAAVAPPPAPQQRPLPTPPLPDNGTTGPNFGARGYFQSPLSGQLENVTRTDSGYVFSPGVIGDHGEGRLSPVSGVTPLMTPQGIVIQHPEDMSPAAQQRMLDNMNAFSGGNHLPPSQNPGAQLQALYAQGREPTGGGQFFTGSAYLAGSNPSSNLQPRGPEYANSAQLPSPAELAAFNQAVEDARRKEEEVAAAGGPPAGGMYGENGGTRFMAVGGSQMLREPAMTVGMRTGRIYNVAGEAGPEMATFTPMRQSVMGPAQMVQGYPSHSRSLGDRMGGIRGIETSGIRGLERSGIRGYKEGGTVITDPNPSPNPPTDPGPPTTDPKTGVPLPPGPKGTPDPNPPVTPPGTPTPAPPIDPTLNPALDPNVLNQYVSQRAQQQHNRDIYQYRWDRGGLPGPTGITVDTMPSNAASAPPGVFFQTPDFAKAYRDANEALGALGPQRTQQEVQADRLASQTVLDQLIEQKARNSIVDGPNGPMWQFGDPAALDTQIAQARSSLSNLDIELNMARRAADARIQANYYANRIRTDTTPRPGTLTTPISSPAQAMAA